VAYTSEIDKLEQRYRENPKGRNFAPLADAYRKAGLLDNAIELCKSGLERHPDYVSAYIVYGRCLIDQKNDAGASDVFRKVLTLDPENVLGLRMLAEMAERGGRFGEAVEWLARLLSADPMNGDAAEALARAKGKAAVAAAKSAAATPAPPRATPPPPVRPSAPAVAVTTVAEAPRPPARPKPVVETAADSTSRPEFVIEHLEEPTSPHLTPAATHSNDIETFDGTLDFNVTAHGAAKADGLEVQEEVILKASGPEVEGLSHAQYEGDIFGAPPAPEERATEAELDLPTVDLPLIIPDNVGPSRLSAMPRAAGPPVPPVPVAPPHSPVPRDLPPPPPAAVVLSDDDGAADTAALSRAEPVLTETMAELYLRQGHQDDALRVYEALLARRPHDARLRARVDALLPRGRTERAGRGTGESVPAFLQRILAGRPRPPESRSPAPAAASALEDAFAIAAMQPERGPDVDALGDATRPAGDTISLDEVFGDESGRGSSAQDGAIAPSPSPPPASERLPLAGGAPGAEGGGFSFDQFFGAAAGSAAPAGGGSAAPASGPEAITAPPSSGPRARPLAEDEGDLDQFQAWLKGLKS
jgi:tetratricopeptide (TPR) repeat protein